MTTSRNILLAVIAAALVAILAPHASAASKAGGGFWTEERMRQAIPAETLVDPDFDGSAAGAPAEPAGAPTFVPSSPPGAASSSALRAGSPVAADQPVPFLAGVVRELIPDPSVEAIRAHGKVFFTAKANGSEPKMYVCSGTVVTSKVESLVITAGHCVFDAQQTGKFMDNWVFVPAYGRESRPFGVWPAKDLATTKEWRRDGNIRYDIGAAIIKRNVDGARIQRVVGSRGIAFSQPRNQRYEALGYPHTDPAGGEFDGNKEYVCKSGMTRRDSPLSGSGPRTTQIRCDMTAGSSGGGWIVANAVHSVTSYSYDADRIHLYGPYFATTAKNFYTAVRGGINKKSRKKISAKPTRTRR